MSVTARVWRFGDNVDTDAIAPGAYMKFGIDVIAVHCMEGLRPEFASSVRRGDIVVAGRNFGVGSSREQAPEALRLLGVSAVVAVSFAGLFYRNAMNLGLPVVVCAQAGEIDESQPARVDLANACVELPGKSLPCEPIPPFLLELLRDGGLVPSLKRRLQAVAVP